jgi:DNA-binding NarL/FixJ family response regulator
MDAMMENPIRVVLGDTHPLVRAGLRAALAASRDIQVVAEASDSEELVALAGALQPDVIVMDPCIEPIGRMAVRRELVDKCRPARVLLVTTDADVECVTLAMEAGAAGVLSKAFADRELADAVRSAAHGEMVQRFRRRYDPVPLPTVPNSVSHERAEFAKLTERERDVLALVAAGYSAPEIGERLVISPKTVDTYKQRIQVKIGLSHRTEYVKLALRLGLLSP